MLIPVNAMCFVYRRNCACDQQECLANIIARYELRLSLLLLYVVSLRVSCLVVLFAGCKINQPFPCMVLGAQRCY